MRLYEGEIGKTYEVEDMHMPLETERRMEALGMTRKTSVTVMNKKRRGAMVIKLRGTRFALGEEILKSIQVREVESHA
ncbi:MAG TPA: FeoA domain-containing protein [Candidatus Scatomonas pullistercoris]|uniref:FeoA domain-containing protein n=1 Tax=Candidatus Scatomonas pullistercoris TaxID=2840920 RepID=A0A9D1P1T3_9FIRM|nr:FeoA domain-containing protein [Candidatus Scatomonas pullistercoris]